MSKTKIILNGEEYTTNGKLISDLINELDLDIKKIAIEKNYQIIFPEDFSSSNLQENDKIEIVHFIGGG